MSGRRVLVLEDEPLIAILVQDWLDELGYEPVGPARSVPEALSIISSQMLHAAILDVSLGNADSFPVADDLKARNIPFAFATGRDERSVPPRHADAPILPKPYDLEAIKIVMNELSA